MLMKRAQSLTDNNTAGSPLQLLLTQKVPPKVPRTGPSPTRKLFGRMMTHLTKGRLALTLVASCAGVARANYGGTRHVSELQELIALSPAEVLNSLDDYDQFWVEAWRGRWVQGGSCGQYIAFSSHRFLLDRGKLRVVRVRR